LSHLASKGFLAALNWFANQLILLKPTSPKGKYSPVKTVDVTMPMAEITAQRIVRHLGAPDSGDEENPRFCGYASGRGNARGGDHRSDP
jgi:hypothetical protein